MSVCCCSFEHSVRDFDNCRLSWDCLVIEVLLVAGLEILVEAGLEVLFEAGLEVVVEAGVKVKVGGRILVMSVVVGASLGQVLVWQYIV
jgi:hypothetical protein